MTLNRQRFTFLSAVHIFLWDQSGRMLMLRRFNTGYEDGNYSIVAGHLDGGETVIEAAVREAKEEAGIDIAPEDIEMVGVMHRKIEPDEERIDFFVSVRRWAGEVANTEPDRCDDLRWVEPTDLPENTIPYIRRALENFERGVWFDTFGL